ATSEDGEIAAETATAILDEWADYPEGIRIEYIKGDLYRGYVMLIRDPSRVYTATSSDFRSGQPGMKIQDAIKKEGAIAAINGGAFPDVNGVGLGDVPLGLVFSKGEMLWGSKGTTYPSVIGFDENNVLLVGSMSPETARDLHIRDALCFGPTLVVNGEAVEIKGLNGGLNPRSAIGQRADGTVILLCIDGRMPSSLGASFADLIQIMLEFGAVNASNLDGGSSSHLYYKGEAINVSSSLYGPRRLPTFFMVKALEDGDGAT
ncbi:MAG: phosphodiester glycosidase family protein, partial [Clostridiales bacterium]|nr:phosphodiester glycosidase family protein [Clostridiales bacterium]